MHTIPDVIAAYLASLEARQVFYHTRRAYGGDLRRFVAVVDMNLAQVAVPDIECFLAYGDVQVVTCYCYDPQQQKWMAWLPGDGGALDCGGANPEQAVRRLLTQWSERIAA